MTYQPIDCSLHDRIEDWATRRTRVRIVLRARGEIVNDEIADWYVADGVEYARLLSGRSIRLDEIESIREDDVQ